tara:strand:- start:20 stop:730 length:711 start_codon:yes stop_codon:yes gene_type:complete
MLMVIGCGFVGGTIADSLEELGNEVVRIDPRLNNNKIRDYKHAEGAIICLPTPTINGEPDDSIIKKVVDGLPNMRILIKSTILPNQIEKYPVNVTYSPEFLREKHAKFDYQNQKICVWGGADTSFWLTKFKDLKKQNVITNRTTASMIKYVHNSWLATKVAFFHELYSKLYNGTKYNEMIGILSMFENIGPSHMKVEKLGYDGSCFPKDVEAFTNFTGSEILKKVMEVNDELVRSR